VVTRVTTKHAESSGPALGPNQPPTEYLPGVISLKVERSEHEADPLTTSAEVTNAWSCTSTPPLVFRASYLSSRQLTSLSWTSIPRTCYGALYTHSKATCQVAMSHLNCNPHCWRRFIPLLLATHFLVMQYLIPTAATHFLENWHDEFP